MQDCALPSQWKCMKTSVFMLLGSGELRLREMLVQVCGTIVIGCTTRSIHWVIEGFQPGLSGNCRFILQNNAIRMTKLKIFWWQIFVMWKLHILEDGKTQQFLIYKEYWTKNCCLYISLYVLHHWVINLVLLHLPLWNKYFLMNLVSKGSFISSWN